MDNEADYLWDKTGEPDPEVQQLEEILGALRYQPQPFEIPSDLKTDPKPRFLSGSVRSLAPRFAIAATIAIALLAVGVWLGVQRRQRDRQPTVARTPNAPASVSNPSSTAPRTPDNNQNEVVTAAGHYQEQDDRPLHLKDTKVASNRAQKNIVRRQQLALNELRKGKAAKDQLMLALRVVSAKLNFAQKKTQNIGPREPVHNQHKIG